ncbi:MOSC and FAD-binding oxidoreductase domain-containing protein [Acidisoma sp. L85]|uniref:MOSC and FAD-binding oxidoreductase domain-containing protein n=1 Tax=Acidisoma sp. L85 TaxID=1641850 RepID=UPI001C201EF3|nr:MOSC and FAD-binding oxidoreductase domain-containing protein [Acidisoma sp. L85]
MVRRLNIEGDGQGDMAGHGGEHRAVFVYQIDSYHHWQAHLDRADIEYGQFGENFTVDGLSDSEVCIGDRYRIGSAVFEVTQPRVTCYRVGIRMNEPQMAALLVAHDRPGFYLRVLEEGEVEAGLEIVREARGPEGMTIAEVNALLYKPGHPADRLEKALRIPELSAGWHSSFKALLERIQSSGITSGNPGLAPSAGPPPAWTGFRPLRVFDKKRESESVTSLVLEPTDGRPLAPGLPGQFIVLRLHPTPNAPTLLRSYSISGEPGGARYRISVKRNPDGVAGAYIRDGVQIGDILDVTAPRGSFVLQPGSGPVVLLSAGIGATPVLAMLHALAAVMSPREVWWIHGAHDGGEHPFAEEVRACLAALPHSHRHILYSSPGSKDRLAVDFDAPGRVSLPLLQELGVPRDADFYLCGPPAFMTDLMPSLAAWGVAANRIHSEMFGAGPALTPGIAAAPLKQPHLPTGAAGTGPLVSFARSGVNVPWGAAYQSILELAEACDVPVRWSCRTGVCHNCETALIAGAVGYQPYPVEPPAEGNVLICCSKPQGDIVIDL